MNKEQFKFIHEQYKKQSKYFNLDFVFQYNGKSIKITDERLPRESNRGQVALIKGVMNFITKLMNVEFEGIIIFKPSVNKNNPVLVKDNYGIINYTFKDMGNIDNSLNRYYLSRNKQNLVFTIDKEEKIVSEPKLTKDGIIFEDMRVIYDILEDKVNNIYIRRKRYNNSKGNHLINSLLKMLYELCLNIKQSVSIDIKNENTVVLSIGEHDKRCVTMEVLNKALKLAAIVK